MEVVKKKKKYKKKKKKIVKEKKVVNRKIYYQIILTSNGKHLNYLGNYTTELKANKAFAKFLEENKKVVFPVRTISTNVLLDAKYEIVIIKRRNEKESKVTKIRNEFGDYINHVTNNDGWVVYDKAPYDLEESFWVYGYHPLVQRKDFMFIFNELVLPKASKKSSFLNVMIYKNKLLLETTTNLDMVICKNKNDSIRLYNQLKEYCDKNKSAKYYLFNGDWTLTKIQKEKCIEKIQKLTNWDKTKITRATTKP